jgi:hypothetical protein
MVGALALIGTITILPDVVAVMSRVAVKRTNGLHWDAASEEGRSTGAIRVRCRNA